MNSNWITAAAGLIGTMVVTGVSSAQEISSAKQKDQPSSIETGKRDLRPVTQALELTLGTGYAQGFGKVMPNQPSLTDLGQAGGSLQLGVGYRVIPQLTLGVFGTGAMFGRGDQVDASTKIYSATSGVQADWHFLPAGHELDPWISLGSGWRGYWLHSDQGTVSMQGMELAKLQIGVDYRIDRAVAISPVVGVDLTTFLTQSTPETRAFNNISNPRVSSFLFAGLQGRFDISTATAPQVAAR
jgi:hypothetical protein